MCIYILMIHFSFLFHNVWITAEAVKVCVSVRSVLPAGTGSSQHCPVKVGTLNQTHLKVILSLYIIGLFSHIDIAYIYPNIGM